MNFRQLATKAATTPVGLKVRQVIFPGSAEYWDQRYGKGGTSGAGSYGEAATYKAETVNAWVREHGVTSVIDWGCGDGNQLSLGDYPRYLGLDRSAEAIRACVRQFASDPSKSFLRYDPDTLSDPAGFIKADLALSMEVIFHLVEDPIFEDYLGRLFDSAERFVAICNTDDYVQQISPHERHRNFSRWVEENRPEWRLVTRLEPPAHVGLISSMFLYAREA